MVVQPTESDRIYRTYSKGHRTWFNAYRLQTDVVIMCFSLVEFNPAPAGPEDNLPTPIRSSGRWHVPGWTPSPAFPSPALQGLSLFQRSRSRSRGRDRESAGEQTPQPVVTPLRREVQVRREGTPTQQLVLSTDETPPGFQTIIQQGYATPPAGFHRPSAESVLPRASSRARPPERVRPLAPAVRPRTKLVD